MQHFDEGTIHAWLDGQLPPDEAVAVEAHVAECRQCADAVAEARGLIAASSRILTALDSVPREVVPNEPRFRALEEAARAANAVADAAADAIVPLELVARRPRRRWFNGASLAAAAAIVVGIGTVAVVQQSGRQMGTPARNSVASATTTAMRALDSTAPASPVPSAAPVRDARSLGNARVEAAQPSVAGAPIGAMATRDAANEAGHRAPAESASALKKAEPDRVLAAVSRPLADTAAVVVREKELVANKPTDELAKDTKQQAQSAQQLQSVQQPPAPAPARRETLVAMQSAKTDSVRSDKTQASADVAGAATSGQAAAPRAAGARAKAAVAVPAGDAPPGAPITAEQSNAVGCYDLGITPVSTSRNNGFLQTPRRVALDSEIVPANAEGVWYRARDLARTNPVANGLWRPTGVNAIELEFSYGSRTARIRVSGPADAMMRGSLEEIDRARATGEAANVVAVRRSCEP
jgi:hypothetical protein